MRNLGLSIRDVCFSHHPNTSCALSGDCRPTGSVCDEQATWVMMPCLTRRCRIAIGGGGGGGTRERVRAAKERPIWSLRMTTSPSIAFASAVRGRPDGLGNLKKVISWTLPPTNSASRLWFLARFWGFPRVTAQISGSHITGIHACIALAFEPTEQAHGPDRPPSPRADRRPDPVRGTVCMCDGGLCSLPLFSHFRLCVDRGHPFCAERKPWRHERSWLF